ncbi:MAG: chemotaxis-specific protein-glutamate methyltransferase CheB [Elusimicrobiota bacterium]
MSNNSNEPLRVLVVDDSITAREIISSILESDPMVKVVGEARNGREAIELTRRLKPDLITMDIKMPVMDGIEATKYIMAYIPTPIVIISQSAFNEGNAYVFQALEHGALEILEKPDPNEWKDIPKIGEKLIKDIKTLSKVPVITHIGGKKLLKKRKTSKSDTPEAPPLKVVAVASSTGGPTALLSMLSKIPLETRSSILIVQHIAEGFVEGLSEWLDSKCKIKVKLAQNGEKIEQGTAYIAPCSIHMVVTKDNTISFTDDPPVNSLKPAADLLFYSVAEQYGEYSIGVVLTGMGKDGAEGSAEIKRAGGSVLVQDESSCLVYGMPKATVEMGVVDMISPLSSIGDNLMKLIEL